MNWFVSCIVCVVISCSAMVAQEQKQSESQFGSKCTMTFGKPHDNVNITAAAFVPAGVLSMPGIQPGQLGTSEPSPASCRVDMKLEERTGADGKPYYIGVQLNMPINWNGNLLFQGGGGLDGAVMPAFGPVATMGSTAPTALQRGFAVISMDGGHQGPDASFAAEQQAKLNYAYQAIGKVTATSKSLLSEFEGRKPSKTYFMGCSNGGREALIAAERYPLEFDGIVAADPAFDLSNAVLLAKYSTDRYLGKRASTSSPVVVTTEDLKMVGAAVLESCDALDGQKDGMIFNHGACHFDPESLRCGKAAAGKCLDAGKIAAIKDAMAGPMDKSGQRMFSPWSFDGGIGTPGWLAWQTGALPPGANPASALTNLVNMTLTDYFYSPKVPATALDDLDYPAAQKSISYTSALTDAVGTELDTFTKRGGKLVLVTGWSDPIFAPEDLIRWYKTLGGNTPESSQERDAYARLFLVPGMTHCGGGPALDDFDPLKALTTWVETDVAPERIIARGVSFPNQTRPLCAYPRVATYDGAGPADRASSYVCR